MTLAADCALCPGLLISPCSSCTLLIHVLIQPSDLSEDVVCVLPDDAEHGMSAFGSTTTAPPLTHCHTGAPFTGALASDMLSMLSHACSQQGHCWTRTPCALSSCGMRLGKLEQSMPHDDSDTAVHALERKLLHEPGKGNSFARRQPSQSLRLPPLSLMHSLLLKPTLKSLTSNQYLATCPLPLREKCSLVDHTSCDSVAPGMLLKILL